MRGSPIRYSAAELQFIEARASMNRSELRAAFVKAFSRDDVTVDHLKNLCSRQGWATRTRWTAEEDALMRELYPVAPTKEVARQLGRTLTTTYQRAHRLGLEKSEAYLASSECCRMRRGDNRGGATRFKKGQAPPNKGLRRPGWARGRMQETQFTSGQRGWNWKPVGSERVIDGYWYTKIDDQRKVPYTVNWKATHILRWEQVNGPLPKGMAMKSLDGDRLNVDAANWVAVPRALLPRLNGRFGRDFENAPKELKRSILAVAQLEHASNEASGLTATQRMIKKRRERLQAERRASQRPIAEAS